MIGYFENVPTELEDAARDRRRHAWQAFRHVALPLARPGIVVGGILAFIFSWNNFIFSVVLGGKNTRTLPSAVYNMLTFEQIAWGPLAAAALLVTLPVLLVTASHSARSSPGSRPAASRTAEPYAQAGSMASALVASRTSVAVEAASSSVSGGRMRLQAASSLWWAIRTLTEGSTG